MRPAVPSDLRARAGAWDQLSRQQRVELGRALRDLGLTYGEIRALIPAAKGTLAGWCDDIRLTDRQLEAIAARRVVPRDTQRKRRYQIERIRAEARTFAEAHLDDPLFVAGTVLYWAEGAKTKQMLAVSNGDPMALRLFIRWTRHFHDPHAEFVLSLHLHRGDQDHVARQWWAEVLGLEHADFTKTFVKPPGTGYRRNRLRYGVCRVRMRRAADAWCRTDTWIGVVSASLTSDAKETGC